MGEASRCWRLPRKEWRPHCCMPDSVASMARVLVATPEPIGRRLAGPAIRAAQITRVLSASHDVTLSSLAGESVSPIDGHEVKGPGAINGDFDAAIVQGSVLLEHRDLVESEIPLVVDWFDPFHLEALHRGGDDPIRTHDLVEGARRTLREQAQRGDFFLCSNHAQREHWLGWLAAAGRLNMASHDDDPLFESLIAVAPFGIGSDKPGRRTPIRETFSVIGPEDPILLWAGGLHDWLDPLLFIRAMPTILDENPDTRLVFLAGRHPNTSIETMGIRGEAISLARKMRMFGKNVLFVNDWVDYRDRLTWLNDATLGVVGDRAHLESRYSHRTRLLDHLAAGLPTVSTAGDPLSQQLHESGAALTIPRDPDHEHAEALGRTIAALVSDDARLREMSKAASELATGLSWEETLSPLLRWLEQPRMAADRQSGVRVEPAAQASSVSRLGDRIRLHLDAGGAKQVVERGLRAGRRRFRR